MSGPPAPPPRLNASASSPPNVATRPFAVATANPPSTMLQDVVATRALAKVELDGREQRVVEGRYHGKADGSARQQRRDLHGCAVGWEPPEPGAAHPRTDDSHCGQERRSDYRRGDR